MDFSGVQDWLGTVNPLILGVILFGSLLAGAALGAAFRVWRDRRSWTSAEKEGQDAYVVSAVLGLLALLLGFTFSLATDRFDARRLLVLQEANAIGTAYLRSQLLGEPHRTRMSELLVRYTDNRITLAKARPDKAKELLTVNDALIVDLWAATSAAFDSVKTLDFSSEFVDGMNEVIDLDASRKTARLARVPVEVFVVLFVCLVTSAAVLGYVLTQLRGRLAAGLLLMLFTLVLLLIVDIDRPVVGGIVESQGPMEELRKSFAAWPPSTFDRWRVASP